MAVPEYQTFMAPALRALKDGQPRSARDIREIVASEIGISEDDRRELIKSGLPVFDSRVSWAVTYMVQAGLITRPRRAMNQITQRGLHVLQQHPNRVDNHILDQFEEFRDFKSRARAKTKPAGSTQEPLPAKIEDE